MAAHSPGLAEHGWPARLARRHGIHYSWVVIGVTFLLMLVGVGLRFLPGVLIKPIEQEFGWDRAAISAAAALGILVYGLCSPLSGKLTDRFGARPVSLAGIALMALGTAAAATMTSLWQFYVFWGLIVGVGAGAVTLTMAAAVANRWFAARRGLATGLLGAGASAGQLVFVPLLMAVVLAAGWRGATLLMAAILLAGVAPLVLLFLRNSPAEVGLAAYGAEQTPPARGPAGESTPLARAIRHRDFWLLAGGFFVCGYTTSGLVGTHLIPHAVEHGFAEAATAGALGLMGLMNILGTMLSGWLTDRFNPQRLLAIYYSFRGVSLLLLPYVSDVPGLLVFAVLYGLDWMATVPPTANLTADIFGRRSIGTIYGMISLSHQIGGAVASYLAGLTYVLSGSYQVAFLSAGLSLFLAAGLSLGISSQRPASRPAAALGRQG